MFGHVYLSPYLLVHIHSPLTYPVTCIWLVKMKKAKKEVKRWSRVGQVPCGALPGHARASYILSIYGMCMRVHGQPEYTRTKWGVQLCHLFHSLPYWGTNLAVRPDVWEDLRGPTVDALRAWLIIQPAIGYNKLSCHRANAIVGMYNSISCLIYRAYLKNLVFLL